MRFLSAALLMLATACGSNNVSHDPIDHPLASGASSQALGSTLPMEFTIKSAAYDTFDTVGGVVRFVYLMVSDADDICADMLHSRSRPGTSRIGIRLANSTRGSAMTGRYPLQTGSTLPRLGDNVASDATLEIFNAQCKASRPKIGSGHVDLTAFGGAQAHASLKLTLAALVEAGELGTFKRDVVLTKCPGLNEASTADRSAWQCR